MILLSILSAYFLFMYAMNCLRLYFSFCSYKLEFYHERLSVSQKARIKHEIKASWTVMYIASLLDIVYFVNGCLSFMHKYFFEKNLKMMLLLEKKNMRNLLYAIETKHDMKPYEKIARLASKCRTNLGFFSICIMDVFLLFQNKNMVLGQTSHSVYVT